MAAEAQRAAAALRRLLAAVERGELDATALQAAGLAGAADAFDADVATTGPEEPVNEHASPEA